MRTVTVTVVPQRETPSGVFYNTCSNASWTAAFGRGLYLSRAVLRQLFGQERPAELTLTLRAGGGPGTVSLVLERATNSKVPYAAYSEAAPGNVTGRGVTMTQGWLADGFKDPAPQRLELDITLPGTRDGTAGA